MKKLYLVCYFNEMESENDADVTVLDDEENQRNSFKVFFKKTYDYDIKDEHIVGIYPVSELFDTNGTKYEVALKKIN